MTSKERGTNSEQTRIAKEGGRSERVDTREARLKHLSNLEAFGIDAYPGMPPVISHTNADVKGEFERLEGREVKVVGRITSVRDHGGLVFYDIEDSDAKLQIQLAKQGEEDEQYNNIRENYDTGDFVHAVGEVFKTRRGEVTVRADELNMLAKALLPPPSERFGKLDPERARRQRYLELMVNPEARERFRTRARMVQLMREEFNFQGFLEVETPVLDNVYGGALAKPFITEMAALDEKMYLRIANELYLKRLVCGNMGPVFEFSRNFRNEGIDRTHNPEFTAVEAYKPYSDYKEMMELAERMFESVAISIHGTTEVKFGEHTIDFKAPWRRFTIYDGLKLAYEFDPKSISDEELKEFAKENGISEKHTRKRGDLLLALFENYYDGKIIQPTFVLDYPKETSPLAKPHREDSSLAERFECVIGGLEVMNCYTELNDPRIQRVNFEAEQQKRIEGDMEAMLMDEDFLTAMEHGFPPMGGIGISIDRMAMLLTNTDHIRDIILFPQVKKAGREK